MIATLNKSKTALTINRQEFKLALEKIGAGILTLVVVLNFFSYSLVPIINELKSLISAIRLFLFEHLLCTSAFA